MNHFRILVVFSAFLFCYVSSPTFANEWAGDKSSGHVATSTRNDPMSDEEVTDYFMHQKNYIPGTPLNTVTKTIYLSFNIWQKDDGTGNLPDNDIIRGQFYDMVEKLNLIFSKVAPPLVPVAGIEYLRDSHIRFALMDITFIRSSKHYGVGCGDGYRLNEYVFREFPHKRRYLNIHFNHGRCRGASGYATFPSGARIEADGFVVTFVPEDFDPETYLSWGRMLHIAHELGHNLGLRHPYDSEYCGFNHPDFLFDLFGFEKQEWCENLRPGCDVCYHQGGWNCDIDDPETTCTNNLMGGNKNPGSITPLQMGRMNRALALKSVRKYSWAYSENPYVISTDQKWPFNIKFYQDIRVRKGATLHITGTLEMVPQASVILEPGAKLIVDGGRITNALYSDDLWQGVVKEMPARKFFSFLRKKIKPADIVLINNGSIDNAIAW